MCRENGKEVEDIVKNDLRQFAHPEKILQEVREYGDELLKERIDIKKGLMELLRFIQSLSIPVAVATATDKDTTYQRLSRLQLWDQFDYILCGNEVHLRKPHPEIYETLLNYFGVDPQEAWVLEDSYVGVEAAYRAHIPCIMIPDLAPAQEKQKRETFAIVDSLIDVIDILKKNIQVTMMTYIQETPQQMKDNIINIEEITKPLVQLYLQKEYQSLWIIACGSSFNGHNVQNHF